MARIPGGRSLVLVLAWLGLCLVPSRSLQPRPGMRLFGLRTPLAPMKKGGELGASNVDMAEEDPNFFDAMESKFRPGRFKRLHYHDDFVYRSCGGAAGTVARVPSAERYTSRDWVHNMLTLPSSTLLKRIRQPVVLLTLWSTFIYGLEIAFGFGSPQTKPHTLLSGALGLLLVFRTNAAYQRFWEGRKIWQGIQDDVRDLVRLASSHAPFVKPDLLRQLGRSLCAFPWVLREHLTGLPCSPFVNLDPAEKRELSEARNRPLFLINKLSAAVTAVPDQDVGSQKELPGNAFSSRERLALLKSLQSLAHHVGAAERLVQTPVPLMYARHTSRFLSIWCLTLPIVLVGELAMWTIPIMSLMTWSLFGIQEIGLMIENPFAGNVLRLAVIADAISLDVRDTIRETTAPYAKNDDDQGAPLETMRPLDGVAAAADARLTDLHATAPPARTRDSLAMEEELLNSTFAFKS